MKTKSKRPSAPARRSRGQQRARARLLHPRAGRRCTPRSRAPPMPRRRRRPFYSMGFARSAVALDIICAAGEASGSGVWRRLTRGRAQACVAWRRRAGAGREYRGAPGSARCLRAHLRERANTRFVAFPTHGPTSCPRARPARSSTAGQRDRPSFWYPLTARHVRTSTRITEQSGAAQSFCAALRSSLQTIGVTPSSWRAAGGA